MTIRVYTHSEQEEKALLNFLESNHYSYNPADETEVPDTEFLNAYNKELEQLEAEIEAGDFYSQEEVKKCWLTGKAINASQLV